MHSIIDTYPGAERMDLRAPDVSKIHIRDIAHHLSLICRFTGAVKHHYSVAQHCVLGSRWIEKAYAFPFLIHDSPEYLLGDVTRPLKHNLNNYGEFEDVWWYCISLKYGVPYVMADEVHDMDRRMSATENKILRPNHPIYGDPMDVTISQWSPEEAEYNFVERFKELTDGKYPID